MLFLPLHPLHNSIHTLGCWLSKIFKSLENDDWLLQTCPAFFLCQFTMAKSSKELDFWGTILWRKSTIYWVTFVHISHLISKIISWDKHSYSNLTVDRVGESKHLTQICTTVNLLRWYLSLGLSDVNPFHKISWPAPNHISCVSFLKYRRYNLEMPIT